MREYNPPSVGSSRWNRQQEYRALNAANEAHANAKKAFEQSIREMEGDTAEIIPGIETPIVGDVLSFNDYCERVLNHRNDSLFQISGAKIGSKLRIKLPSDGRFIDDLINKYKYKPLDLSKKLTNYVPPSEDKLKMDAKIYKIAKAITQTRPWLAYSECEAIARDVLKEMEK